MTWNHRMIRHTRGEETWYAIHEVYYDEKGRAHSCTMDSITPCGETPEDLAQELRRFLEACELPALDYSFFDKKGQEVTDPPKTRDPNTTDVYGNALLPGELDAPGPKWFGRERGGK